MILTYKEVKKHIYKIKKRNKNIKKCKRKYRNNIYKNLTKIYNRNVKKRLHQMYLKRKIEGVTLNYERI